LLPSPSIAIFTYKTFSFHATMNFMSDALLT
jgi:hypothetical protein